LDNKISQYVIRAYFENVEGSCLEQELQVFDPSEAIAEAKRLKTLVEIQAVMVVEKAQGYMDRIIYEFERHGLK